MDVKLQSEIRPRPKAAAVYSTLLLLAAAIGLSMYAASGWYFAKPATWWLAALALVLGIHLALLMHRSVPDTRRVPWRPRQGATILLLIVPFLLVVGFALGAPALVLRLLGPDQQITTTVLNKDPGSRACPRKIVLSRFSSAWSPRICVSQPLSDRLKQGQKVVVEIRESPFGVLAFSIRPREWGPE